MKLAEQDVQRALLALDARAAQIAAQRELDASTALQETVRDVGRFRDYVLRQNPTLLSYEHVPRLVDVGQRVADGELTRVVINMPPRYLKSEVWSRLFTGYTARRYPDRWSAIISYGANLAWNLSDQARSYYKSDGGEISTVSDAKHEWHTTGRGGLWAAGTGGSMFGFGFHFGVVDDPLDPKRRAGFRDFPDWWTTKFLNRQEPGAAIILVMQRLDIDDPVDFLLRREVGEDTEEAPEGWHFVICDEIKEDAPLWRGDGPQGLPHTCTLEPDPRSKGMILAPSRFNRSQVEHMQRTAGEYTKAAQRQQRPAATHGDFWRDEWFRDGVLPEDAFNRGWDWDLAYTKEERNSASAGIETARGPDPVDANGEIIQNAFLIYVLDVDWDWLEFPELVPFIRSKGGPHYIEDKASGKSAKQTLEREGIAVSTVTVKGDKLARASDVQPVVSNRRVRIISRDVRRRLLESVRMGLLRIRSEHLATDTGDLDLNDAFVQAIKRHVGGTDDFWFI